MYSEVYVLVFVYSEVYELVFVYSEVHVGISQDFCCEIITTICFFNIFCSIFSFN